MALEVKELKKRYKTCETRKEMWRSIYEEAYEFCLPMRNLYDGYYEQNTPGQNKMKRVFDSTAIHSTSRFANRRQTNHNGNVTETSNLVDLMRFFTQT